MVPTVIRQLPLPDIAFAVNERTALATAATTSTEDTTEKDLEELEAIMTRMIVNGLAIFRFLQQERLRRQRPALLASLATALNSFQEAVDSNR